MGVRAVLNYPKKLFCLIQITRKQLKFNMEEEEENSVPEVLGSCDDYLTEPETDSNQSLTTKKHGRLTR